MSHHSPQSSSANGPPSSPFGGTNPTVYSPEADRKPHHRRQLTAIAPGQQIPKNFLPQAQIYIEGAFVDEFLQGDPAYVSRYHHVQGGADIDHLQFLVQSQMRRYACFLHAVPFKHEHSSTMYVRYDTVSDAAEGKDILLQAGLFVNYVSIVDFANAQGKDTGKVKECEGQITLSVSIEPNPDHAIWEFTSEDLGSVTKNTETIAKVFGPVRNVVHVDTLNDKMHLVFRIEFDSVDAAHRAIQSLRKDPVYGLNADESFYWTTDDVGGWLGERLLSPPRYLPRIDNQGQFFPGTNTSPTRRSWSNPYNQVAHRSSHHPHDQHNRVRRERILDGSDVRTTVMLRNIPNTLDWMALKNIIDIACFGTYDFIYLRIDFNSGCNVGYAFINFTDANGMLMLIDRIERRFWPGFKSDKAAEISYATIQGREALVQKFRNSSVMQETPFCRPRLIITYAAAEQMDQIRLTGTEEPFPRPDNISKLQRSMDSARSTGLYPPRGYSSGTEYRNRSSAYDRGSPRDMVQAAMHFAHQHAAPVQFGGLTKDQKRDIEAWYLNTFGGGQRGAIGFDFIPMTHITQYFHEHPGSVGKVAGAPSHLGRIMSPWRPVALQHFSTMGQQVPRHHFGRAW
ncbi:hypothetical protein AG0111_0g11334 [Alternaria gaisen]|uniref:Uncharacterized protein n=1 Tax=Alternaria gaisen TaxID=167740 RepID=A0ACB6F7E3_9PLEO|nr:hypothetical protein AG0111_0g11334 [Alternaria gaisen]